MLCANPSVAILVHDFPQLASSSGTGPRTCSITIKGEAEICTGDDEEKFRGLHLKKNPDYEQFIVGPNIAVLAVRIVSARMVDNSDRVKHWSPEKGSGAFT
jgi:hypothetical protein